MAKRIFAAVNVSLETLRRLGELQRTLHRQIGSALRVAPVPTANLHVTLNFYGPVHDEQVEAAADALRRAASDLPAFRLRARGLGVFPDARRPRVLWVGLADGQESILALRNRLEDLSAALGFERDARAFHAHLTLGRVKEGQEGVEPLMAEHEQFDGLASTVTGAVLYESRLQRAGAEYAALAHVPLLERLSGSEASGAPASGPPGKEVEP
jgi:RNA 2',3'-cyclic 3'-phosphodiesterase